MLDLSVFDSDDRELLEESYEAIQQKDRLQIVGDGPDRDIILQHTLHAISLPSQGVFSFQNLFKLTLPNGTFYIGQCITDYGHPVSRHSHTTGERKYAYQLIGIAYLAVDLGKTYMRPETKMDKLIGRFFDGDIDFQGKDKFSDLYYLVSDKKEDVLRAFNKEFRDKISNYKNVLLVTKNK
jgi:hypothetical protein